MERYTFLGNVFDIDRAKELVRGKPVEVIGVGKVRELALQLISHLKDSSGNIIEDNAPRKDGVKYSITFGTSVRNTKWALKHADLDCPVIWFHSPELSVLIDGYHRLYRAWKEGKGLKVQFIDTEREARKVLVDWVAKKCPVKQWFRVVK